MHINKVVLTAIIMIVSFVIFDYVILWPKGLDLGKREAEAVIAGVEPPELTWIEEFGWTVSRPFRRACGRARQRALLKHGQKKEDKRREESLKWIEERM